MFGDDCEFSVGMKPIRDAENPSYIGNVNDGMSVDLRGKVIFFYPPQPGKKKGRLVIKTRVDKTQRQREYDDEYDDEYDEDDDRDDGKNPHAMGR